jgi:acetyl-CoA carboxylase carboxyl transferase subunit beta
MDENRWFGKVPEGIVTKCPKCRAMLLCADWLRNLRVCPKCDYHFRLSGPERIELLFDPGSFEEFDSALTSADPLGFPEYPEKLKRDAAATGLASAVITGRGLVESIAAVAAVTDSRFLMGSMDSAVGEKVTRAVERATAEGLPVVTVCGTGGGARMHEGILSLMQMAKTSGALARHGAAGLLHISILTDPSMAGVLASWASLGDVILAEPGAMIGFAGLRVSKQAQVLKIPKDFQTSEFQQRHGMVDKVVHRRDLKTLLAFLLAALSKTSRSRAAASGAGTQVAGT